MKTLKNIVITGFFILGLATSIHAQTQIKPFTGIDALRLNNQVLHPIHPNCLKENTAQDCIERGFVINTPLIGVKINQMLGSKIALSYQSFYTNKKFDYISYSHSIVHDQIGKHVGFNHFMHQLGVNYYLSERLHIGAAWALQQYRNITLSFEQPDIDRLEIPDRQVDNKHQYGGTFRVGYSIQHINIEASFYQGINTSKISDWEYVEINTSQQIALTVGYMFNLKFRTRKNKTACPKF